MSNSDARLEARGPFDPVRRAREAQAELERMRAFVESIRETVAQGEEVIRRSQELIDRIPGKW